MFLLPRERSLFQRLDERVLAVAVAIDVLGVLLREPPFQIPVRRRLLRKGAQVIAHGEVAGYLVLALPRKDMNLFHTTLNEKRDE